ncbi:YihY/virulence factor BrkB family protein [soil metagenome]
MTTDQSSPVPPASNEPPGPTKPTELGGRGFMASVMRALKEMKQDRVTLTAGSLAYYWFLSLFPALIALIGVIVLVQLDPSFVTKLVDAVKTALPGGASTVITDAVKNASQSKSGGTIAAIIGVALALWSATSGMGALQDGLNIAYDVPEDRNFIAKRLMAIPMLLALLVLGAPAAALLVFRDPLEQTVAKFVPLPDSLFHFLWTAGIIVVALIFVSLMFSALYYLGPKRDNPHWRWVSPGGIIGTLIWLLASFGLSFYISAGLGSYSETYGSLAGVVLLILWLYLTGLALLIGGELNAELERQAAMETEKATA